MATRVNDIEVKQIINTSIDTTPFITAASELITTVMDGSGMSATMLKEIERWYTAHLVSARDTSAGGALKRKKVGDAEEEYAIKLGSGLEGTRYGAMVKELDYTGRMASIGKKAAVLTHINITPD